MRIRTAIATDLPAVQHLAEVAFGPYVPRIGMRPMPMDADYLSLTEAGAVWMAEVDGVSVGYCVLLPEPDTLLLDAVAVDPAVRGHGVGGRLIAFAEDEAARRGLGRVRLYTHRLMTENIALYRHLGYREVEGPREKVPRVHFVKGVA